ncbi:MAG TPA: hypothetical protein VFY29_17770 [Terriglobia bacterium]|nr:hypothetical protein [Terriglobia bacterium]
MLSALRARLESALRERILSPFTDPARRVSDSAPTGIAELDALIGGLPRGAITEIFGPPSSGRTGAAIAMLAQAAARDEACALVDGADAFDPQSGLAAGLDLAKLLWIRCGSIDQALKTTDLLLQGGGFGCIVMDLSDLPAAAVRRAPPAIWFRLQRAVEKTPTTLIALNTESVLQSAAGLALRMETIASGWSQLLDTIDMEITVVRGRPQQDHSPSPNRNTVHVRLHIRPPFTG